jgi:hypothetical protein
LEVGAKMLADIELHSKTRCGYAAMRAVTTKDLDDRMESFFLAETLKYLYLLFDTGIYTCFFLQRFGPKRRELIHLLKTIL